MKTKDSLALDLGLIAFQVAASAAIAVSGYGFLTQDTSSVGNQITSQMKTGYEFERDTAKQSYLGRNRIVVDADLNKVGEAAVLRSRLEVVSRYSLLSGFGLAFISWVVPELMVLLIRSKLLGGGDRGFQK